MFHVSCENNIIIMVITVKRSKIEYMISYMNIILKQKKWISYYCTI